MRRLDPIEASSRARLAVIGLRGVFDIIGGIETHCKMLYPALAEYAPELDITLIVRRRYSADTPHHLGAVAITSLPAPEGQGVEAFVHSFIALIHARFRLHADIMHFHGIGPGIFAPVARLMGAKVIVTHHAADFVRPKWGRISRAVLRMGEAMAARFAHRIICVSGALQEEFLVRHPSASDRTVTIRHGAPPQLANAPSYILRRNGLIAGGYLLAVGRLERTKHYEDLILAHEQAGPDALPLVIVGAEIGGERYEQSLHAIAGPQVHFLGAQSNGALATLYDGAARFFHPSQMEGFGLVVLEALGAGVPVTVSDIPVHREFRLPDDSYVRIGDIDALADIIGRTDARTARWPGAEAVVARHSEDKVVRAYAEIYRAFLPVEATVSNRVQ